MTSSDELAAGIAHEINYPISIVASNLEMLEKYNAKIVGMLEGYRALTRRVVDSYKRLRAIKN